MVLPRALRRSFLELVHSKPLSGHMGRNRTTDRIRDIVLWPWMSDDISTYVKGCDACQRHKRTKNPESTRLQKTEVPKSPLSQIQIDFMGPFQPSVPEKFRYVLAIQDVLTRYAMLIPTADCTASTAASMLLTRWVTVLDIPEVIQSDQGSHFTGQVFRKLCEAMGMEQRLSSPNHPQSNGQVERQNQLLDNIRCVCDNNPAGWADAVVAVQYATTHQATQQLDIHLISFCFIKRQTGQSGLQCRSHQKADSHEKYRKWRECLHRSGSESTRHRKSGVTGQVGQIQQVLQWGTR